ncbi:serine hydrolase [Vitiosangium sp. GDMCC 1.1324]|uniref:serine hydrolase domain-containing protein n=1 Tax=Vitiosangium sp. (strain GDMCC 1.1324) TaxID=2138576 RepID=UPI001E60A9B3|nr:serine hydrolase domain-containing protein [Vitiosangium sp. GDMCC 1.1324]
MNAVRVSCCLVAAVLAWSAQASPARAQAVEDADATRRHQQVDAIFAPWSGADTPGCAVGISRDGVLDYARGYGVSNLEYDVPITPESIFHVASISKQFTAFSILLLAHEGKLSLDDDIRKYLPELPDYGKTITIAHLLHHTSGLREQGQLLNLAGWRSDDLSTQADMLWAVTRQRKLNFDPGSEVVYGNAGYTLLALVVKQVTGQSLRAFADERIFRPLGMSDTHFHVDHSEIVKRRTSAYRPGDKGGWRVSIPNYDHYGSTSLFTSVGDLLKWQDNLIRPRAGATAVMASMLTSGTLNDGRSIGYGGGVMLSTYRGLRTIEHDGVDAGYRADALTFPDQRLNIAVLCNGASIEPQELAQRIAEVYLGDRMGPKLVPAVEAPMATLQALAGTYWSPLTDEVVRVEMKDGALRQVGVKTAFVPIGKDVFRPGESTHEWRFRRSADGRHALSILDFWPTARSFERVSAPMPTPAALASFAGQYRSDEVDMTYAVRLADGKLTMRWSRQKETALEAVGGDRFISDMLGTVTFTRTATGEVNGLMISNRRLRRLHAERLATSGASAQADGP